MARAKIIQVPNARSRIIATKSARSTSVVAHGNSIAAVLSKARKAGAGEPVLLFVPKPGQRYIYRRDA